MARILVIDDEEMVRQTTCAALQLAGHDVSSAPDGEEGVNLFRQQPFDLVITDIRMPRLSGTEVIKVLRSLRPEIRVIISGGGGSVPAIEPAAFARYVGADCVLQKPFTVQELNIAVAGLVNVAKGG